MCPSTLCGWRSVWFLLWGSVLLFEFSRYTGLSKISVVDIRVVKTDFIQ